ncbi:EsaB/YukD family protein [Nocardioides sp. AX2bis]|uniref:EsaB/YukD family protein n=1 Tax=Nocardioides sp. AX2bis TaxID=2653157 RepID=UPI00135A9A31|nr:EsaB/YukD family protein [Nocardioides sp. AX2bis]
MTVLVGGRRTDLAVPAGLPVAELLPVLVGSVDAPAPDATGHLALAGGRPLDPEVPLEDQGVRPGAVLVVTPAAPAPLVRDDRAEALGAEVARAASWTSRQRDAARPLVAAVLGLLAAAGVVGLPDAAAGGVVGTVGVLTLLVLAAWSSRTGPEGATPTAVLSAVLAVVLACLLAAAAAAALVGAPGPGPAWLVTAGPPVGAAVVATALVGAAALTRRRGLLLVAVLPGATLTVLGLLARAPAAPEALLAGAVVGLVLLGGVAPELALAVVGRGGDGLVDPWAGPAADAALAASPGGGAPVDHGGLDVDAARAADLLAGTAGGVGVLLVVAAPLLAVVGRSAAALGAVLALHLVLRSRRSHSALLVAADLGCGAVALAGIAGVLLVNDPAAREVLTPALVLLVPLPLLVGPVTSVGARRIGDLAETATAVALLPLLAVVTGLLDLVGG